jgi:glucose/arabinose dehydrogenase
LASRPRAVFGALSLGCLCAVAGAAPPSNGLVVPKGFTASLYASGIAGARDLAVAADGTLELNGRGPGERYEISPATADAPVTVMRVATELDALEAPRIVRLFAYPLDSSARVPGARVAPQTLALAHALERQDFADVALAPDGSLFVADSRAGAVWRVRRTAL